MIVIKKKEKRERRIRSNNCSMSSSLWISPGHFSSFLLRSYTLHIQVSFAIHLGSDESQLLTALNLNFRHDLGWAGFLDLHWLSGSEDGQRLGRAVVSVGPGPGLSLRLYSTDPRHLVWHWAPGSGLGPGLQLQNIPTHKKIIRQVLSGEISQDLTSKVTV